MQGTSIGENLRAIRIRRGYTQQFLARQAGLSLELVSKLERGERQSTSFSSLSKLARALDVSIGDLTGKAPALEPVPGAGILAVRDAVLCPSELPDHQVDGDDGEPADTTTLWQRVERDYGAYFAGEFGALSADLPGLISECRRSAAGLDPVAAAGPLAHAYQLAACILVHTGRDDAAAAAAERAVRAARCGDDPYRLATLYGTYAWVLLHQGRYTESENVSTKAAEEIEPRLSAPLPQQMTAWGGLILHAAVAASGREDLAAVQEYLSAARAGAQRISRDRNDYWVSFGPTHVGIQTTHVMTEMGRPDLALQAGDAVSPDGLYPILYGRHRLNIAKCVMERGRSDDAIEIASHAAAISPEWFRHQGIAKSLVADLVERKTRLPAPLRGLVQTIGL